MTKVKIFCRFKVINEIIGLYNCHLSEITGREITHGTEIIR